MRRTDRPLVTNGQPALALARNDCWELSIDENRPLHVLTAGSMVGMVSAQLPLDVSVSLKTVSE